MMIASDAFVFLHLHKSGGTFVNQLMLHCLPSATRIGYHFPYAMLPAAFCGLPVLGTVRNPLAYYVSWYHFQAGLRIDQRNALFQVMSDGGTLGFGDTIERLVGLHDRSDLIAALRARLPDSFGAHGLNLTKRCIDPLAGSGKGFYRFLHDRLYAGADAVEVVRCEDLRSGLGRYLAVRAPSSRACWEDFLRRAPAMNASRHGASSDYFTPALRRLVEQADGPLFERYRYAA